MHIVKVRLLLCSVLAAMVPWSHTLIIYSCSCTLEKIKSKYLQSLEAKQSMVISLIQVTTKTQKKSTRKTKGLFGLCV